MKRKPILGIGIGIVLLLLFTMIALAKSSYLTVFNETYGTQNTRLDSCSTCHPGGRTSSLDAYGEDMLAKYGEGLSWGEAIIAIESFDSDGDGWTNLEEINALTFPGVADDYPNPPTPTPTNTPSPTATEPSPTPTDPDPTATFTSTPTVQTFTDVPLDHWAFAYIEALYREGYVAGCSSSPLMYCPESAMTRAESAVFIERGTWGAEFVPEQPIEQTFEDVLLSEWYAKWADGLWNDGFTAGCGTSPLIYCPLTQHSIAEGTVFYLRMSYGTDYQPPDPIGLFDDVPVTTWYAKWIEQAYQEGLLIPCETSPDFKACPMEPLTRAMGAYMMVIAKDIPLD
jgi:hypothetical protein